MQYRITAQVEVFNFKGKCVFTFPYEYIWIVPESQRKLHPLNLESRAKMLLDYNVKREIDKRILSNQEWRSDIEKAIKHFNHQESPLSSYIGFFLPGYEDRTITLESE